MAEDSFEMTSKNYATDPLVYTGINSNLFYQSHFFCNSF